MKRHMVLLTLMAALVIAGLAGCSLATAPSVCDSITAGDSHLCAIAGKTGVRLEDIGNTLIVANAVAIGSGAYTQDQARLVLQGLRASLDSPLSYLAMQDELRQVLSKYPGLFIVATIYLDQFGVDQVISPVDTGILKSWLDRQIATLAPPPAHQ